MIRKALTIALALAAVVFAAAMAVSCVDGFSLSAYNADRAAFWVAHMEGGAAAVSRTTGYGRPVITSPMGVRSVEVGPYSLFWTRGTIRYQITATGAGGEDFDVGRFPAWQVAAVPLLLALYPVIALARGPYRRVIRRRRGLCIGCGYDLTGNESGVCPECALKIAAR